MQSASSCFSREESAHKFFFKKAKRFKMPFMGRGDNKINNNFLATAKALVARNFAWALPKQKGTIK